ncbi:helix-turn-helix transcriptional regulator [Paractinoplanes atraurantiacus]|uniref:Regulatory protein, luxR family n=1 Tax=Paractinoplanes atraurantiacus TaxID=1036182 RepID=A0A285I595_9ACTN|nr:helix-turn-helix transcriptional regulator [Actinoplanes atraurantiacus]SNY43007.1 regulatory protein, luxR family [Actinoplanes atraurantiacus]
METLLRGRRREQEELDRLLRDIRSGQSRVLVLRGEAGAGKTALLDYLVETASGERVARTAGVEPETEIAYSGLQQLCAPLLDHLERLPEPQRQALATGFGLAGGDPPDALIVGLAVLGLFAEAGAEQPLLCVVDDVQWLDRMSEVILTFVARRLDSESVALVFGARSPGDEQLLGGLPELRVEGLPDADARALLDSVLPSRVDARVRDRIVAETRGNPLALLELPRGLSPAELAFGFGLHSAAPLAGRVEAGFERRIAALPGETRTVLLAAAVEPIGDVPLLWRALDRLGVGVDAAGPAETAGLVEFGTRVRFRHPLVRSAAWRSAPLADLRRVHAALAQVTDPAHEPDRRAWHRAHAAVGPDEEVAAELEESAGRALARGGRSAAAAFLERAAQLTPEPGPRAGRALAAAWAQFSAGAPAQVPELLAAAELGPLDPLQQADVEVLRSQLAFALNPGRSAVEPLLGAARRLVDLDRAAAVRTYFAAAGAAVHAGGLGGDDLRRVAAEARTLPADETAVGRLLTGIVAWALDGPVPAIPLLAGAAGAFVDDEDLASLWMLVPALNEARDDEAFHRLTERAVRLVRDGALALSGRPAALTFRAGALLHAGRFADASVLVDEAKAFHQATGMYAPPGAELSLVVYREPEDQARAMLDAIGQAAAERSEGRVVAHVAYHRALLNNQHGRYQAAVAAARAALEHPDLGIHRWVLNELVEAAARSGDKATAAEARDRIAELTAAHPTAWARGELALANALTGPDEEQFREALRLLPASRLGLEVARVRLLYGEWLRRENRRTDARAHLRAAHEAFTTMGAVAFAERAGRELTATGETVRSRTAAAAPDSLTGQESQIARLAVSGRTNPEIGAVLFLSPRTVEWHLRKIFTKLGITSRRELARALSDR